MNTRTQWFGIDDVGQPVHVGWWEARYAHDAIQKWWWDGDVWRVGPRKAPTMFGNIWTAGECYRGLATKPKAKP
jgi:hypothetical protein